MKAKATKQTKLSLKRTAKEVAATPAAQIKKLFALVKEAKDVAWEATALAAVAWGALDRADMLAGLSTPTQWKQQAGKTDILRDELAAANAEVAKLKACNTVGVRTAAQEREAAKNYVLTEGDWRRVIDEKFLTATGGGYYSEIGLVPGRGYREHYKLLNKPGVMQPYFGQGCPEEPSTRVLVKFRDGKYGISLTGGVIWHVSANMLYGRDIVAYTVLA